MTTPEPQVGAEAAREYIDKLLSDAHVQHDCPGTECHPYPTFDDDPARWGLREPESMTHTEAEAAAEAEAWGGREPSASFAEWLAEGQQELEAEL